MQRQPSGRLICPDGCLFSYANNELKSVTDGTILKRQIKNFVLFMQKIYRNR